MSKDTMNLPIVSYGQSKLLKKLGFLWQCDASYQQGILINMCYPYSATRVSGTPAPFVAYALKWLRDEKDHNVNIIPVIMGNGKKMYLVDYFYGKIKDSDNGVYETYEKAESAGLDFVLNHLNKTSVKLSSLKGKVTKETSKQIDKKIKSLR